MSRRRPRRRSRRRERPSDPYTQLREAGALDKRGRQRELVKEGPRKPSERGVIVPRGTGATVISRKRARKMRRTQRAMRNFAFLNQLLDDLATIHDLKDSPRQLAAELRGSHARAPSGRAKPADPEGKTAASAQDTEIAGLPLGSLIEDVERRAFPESAPGLRVLQAPFHLGRAFVEDPAGTAKSSLRTAKESIAGIPQGVKMLVEDPGKALDQIAKDYEQRYGSLLEGDTATFRRRIKEDFGVTPYMLDAAALAGGVGAAGGAVARAGAFGRLVARLEKTKVPLASQVGKAGGKAHRAVTEERPRLRVSGGAEGAKAQRTSRNLFAAAGQRGLDKARARRYRRDVVKAGLNPATGGRLERVPDAEPGRLPALRPGEGEVLPYYSVRELPMLRRIAGRTERTHGRRKGSERIRLLSHQGKVERVARKLVDQLDGREKAALKYVMQLGLSHRNLDGAVAALRKHRAEIVEARKSEGEVSSFEPDELKQIDEILENPERYITGNVRQVADELRAIEHGEAALDPDLPAERAGTRRLLPQSIVLGERRAPDREEFLARLDQLEQKLRRQGVDPGDLEERFGGLADVEPPDRGPVVAELERALRSDSSQARRALATADKEAATVLERAGTLTRQHESRAERELPDATPAEREQLVARRLARTYEAVEKSQGKLLAARARRDDTRLEHEVAARLRKELKHRPGRYESAQAFEKRVTRAAEEAGLEAPAYWESTGGAPLRRSLRAIGTGVRAAAPSKGWTGARFRAGREAGDPEVVISGLMRNAKRRFSWRFVTSTVAQSAFEWSRGRAGGGLSAKETLREIERRHIDPDTLELVNVRILQDRELDAEGLARGDVIDPDADASPTGGVHPDDLVAVHHGLDQARATMEALRAEVDYRGQAPNRYLAVPKRDFDELAAATRPDGVVGRAIDILWKQKPARILLGLANTSWLAFQVMSNGFLAGLGGARNPFDYVSAQTWWKGLSEAEKLAIEPELGITHRMHAIGDETKLGAATSNRFIDAYRAFKQTRTMRTLKKGNPLDLMFRIDEVQNNFFRRTVFYNQAKRDAYRRMGSHVKALPGLQGRIVSVLERKGPGETMRGLVREADTFERHAEHVRDWMGDYLTFSAKERTTLSRSIMFYGYLRFSLRTVFWTMPAKHPVTAAILADLGRMGAQEIKHLLGVPPNSDVPMSMLAHAYFGTAEQVQAGKPGSGTIPFGRMNPLMNAITQADRPTQLFGLMSPLLQAEMDQFLAQSTFTGRSWRIGGLSTPSEAERPTDYFGSIFSQFGFSTPDKVADLPLLGLIPGVKEIPLGGLEGSPRGRILQRQLLSLAAPFRLWEDSVYRGPQSDDSLPWDPVPMRYKDEDAAKGAKQTARRQEEEGSARAIARTLVPLLGFVEGVGPQPTLAGKVLEREREKRKAVRQRKRRKRGGSEGGSVISGGGGSGGSSGSIIGGGGGGGSSGGGSSIVTGG